MIKRHTPSEKEKVPQEHPCNPMRGYAGSKKYLIQPHNFRRYFTFSKGSFDPTQPYSLKNYNSEYHFENFYGCHIVVRKNSIEIINLWHKKQWRLIEVDVNIKADFKIEEIRQQMEIICIKALRKFVHIHGGETDFKPLPVTRKSEIGIHGDDFIDKIPRGMIITDTVFKKVYNDKVEFLGEASIKNYINNRTQEDFIHNSIAMLIKRSDNLKLLQTPLSWLFENFDRAEWFNNLSINKQNEVLGIG